MKSTEHLKHLVAYNLWANKRIAEVLSQTTDMELNKEITSSFSSIRKTVYHIWDAEYIWLSRINGVSLKSFPSKEFGNDIAINSFLSCSEEWVKSVADKDESFFEKICIYKNIKQIEFSNSHSEIVMHCMNHSTYHRGQLVTLLRQAGKIDLPSTDMIAFFREK
jgi:uncharacterized damage-inducible protein DinB